MAPALWWLFSAMVAIKGHPRARATLRPYTSDTEIKGKTAYALLSDTWLF